MLRVVAEHGKQINDIQTDRNQACIITASKDCTAKVGSASEKSLKGTNTQHSGQISEHIQN